jgi:hypothetical protein
MEVLVESNESNYLYFGLMGRGWGHGKSAAFNKSGCWSIQADGYMYDNGSGSSHGSRAQLRSGARVGLNVDMDAKSVEFFVNGVSIKTCAINVDAVCLAACLGGSNQLLVLQDGGSAPAPVVVDGPSFPYTVGNFHNPHNIRNEQSTRSNAR